VDAIDVRCDVISALVVRWQRAGLEDVERDAYEQHLLFCPPCLVQNDKARLAFAALPAAATERPPDDLVGRLAEQVVAGVGGHGVLEVPSCWD
jgi:hypothetical protein